MAGRGALDFQPKLLPGQEGYRMTETDSLEKEAKAMETRLRQLQERMQQQQLDDAALPKTGGARWKSARSDKSAVRSFAKDVQDRHKKLSEQHGGGDPALYKAHAPTRRQAREVVGGDFRSKGKFPYCVL